MLKLLIIRIIDKLYLYSISYLIKLELHNKLDFSTLEYIALIYLIGIFIMIKNLITS